MKNLPASLSACLQALFPRKHIIVHLLYGFSFSLSYLLPHPNWVSKDTLLIIQGVYVVLLCVFSLILYLIRSELFLLPSSGWGALSHAVSGLFFLALSCTDWLVFQNPPILAVSTGIGILLIQFVYAFKRVTQAEAIE